MTKTPTKTAAVRTIVLNNHKPKSMNQWWSGMHWSKRSAHKDKIKLLMRKALGTDLTPHPDGVRITLVSEAKRPLDSDNIMPKPYIDALTHYGILPDDTPTYVQAVTLCSRKASYDRLTITIEEVNP